MGPLVVLALALAAAAVGAAVLAALQLLKGARGLRAGVEATNLRLAPLLDELRAEAAVSATETEAVRASLATLSEVRGDQRQQARVRSRQRAGLRSRSSRRAVGSSRVRPGSRLAVRRRRP